MRRTSQRAFTLVELVIASAIAVIFVTGTAAVLFAANRIWYSTGIANEVSVEASEILGKIVYGIGTNGGVRAAQAGTVNVSTSGTGWTVSYAPPGAVTNYFLYNKTAKMIFYSQNAVSTNNAIGCHVASATLRDYTNGLAMTVTVARAEGRFSATNQMSTFVRYRN